MKFVRDEEILSTFNPIKAKFNFEKLIEKYVECEGVAIR